MGFYKSVITFANSIMKYEVVISHASPDNMSAITELAKKFELDCENMDWSQFIIAKRAENIIGFGRLRKHAMQDKPMKHCYEIATLGIIPQERKKGIGSLLVKELIRTGPSEIFITCVIPNFFERLGFRFIKQYPSVLRKKVDFCKTYDFKDDEIFIMRLGK